MLKSFVPFKPNDMLRAIIQNYVNTGEVEPDLLDTVESQAIQNPENSAWQSVGYSKVSRDWVMSCGSNVFMLIVTIADRILPGSVIRTALAKRVKEVEKKEQRKVGKKEQAQLKDEILPTLLEKSHIRYNHVPVLFSPDYVIVGSSSVRVVDIVISNLTGLFQSLEPFDPADLPHLSLVNIVDLPSTLNAALLDCSAYDFIDLGDKCAITTEHGVIKFTQTDLGSEDVRTHLKGNWATNSLQVKYGSTSDEEFTQHFVVEILHSGIFRGLKPYGILTEGFKPYGILTEGIKTDLGDDATDKVELFKASAYIYYREIANLINQLVAVKHEQQDDEGEL